MSLSSVVMYLLVCALAPLLPGIATRTKSLLTGRRGSPVWQLYADLAKLFRKGAVYSRTTTLVFRAAPVVLIATSLLAAGLLPLDGRSALLAFPGDLVGFAGLLALGRFALVLAGLDTGSSFEGMGASREVMVATFAEPALFLGFVVLALATGRMSLEEMLGVPLASVWSGSAPSLVLAAASFFMVLLAETSRVPVDDPATHLELTMIHEVMILDHSGPDLGLILLAGSLKLALFGTLVTSALVPRGGMAPFSSGLVLIAGLVVIAVGVGMVESVMARLRMNRLPQFLVAASALAGLAVILELQRP
ncbi:MAG: NADH-quinone oxidoreductase subunit H [Gemmatimonadota bacterium]